MEQQPPPELESDALSFSDLLATEDGYRDGKRVMGSFVALGEYTFMYAPPKAGKTTVSIGLAISIAAGQNFIGEKSTGPRRVLYVDGDMGFEPFGVRVKQIAHGLFPNLSVEVKKRIQSHLKTLDYKTCEFSLTKGADQARLATEANNADVIILDNYDALSEKTGKGGWREQWKSSHGFIVQMQKKGKAVILIHHAQKTPDPKKPLVYEGDAGMARKCDTEVIINESALRSEPGKKHISFKFGYTRHMNPDEAYDNKLVSFGSESLGSPGRYKTVYQYEPIDALEKEKILEAFENKLKPQQIAIRYSIPEAEVLALQPPPKKKSGLLEVPEPPADFHERVQSDLALFD